ncbi:BirA family biotin operon repressor/biotin-[acetyl-CoA-carboxylase] ligase [Prauserella shujinwangii]|uniref:biotin--[biotin carboxyl-carrier protein] ligase n=1 Tax=Prauserella shujinwangii TaxID=1453103 RepID=A0A2T0LMM0_9PSEU|nr:biotin--[acetyl-CoA-carboxylase] ligase [Prauserella shujinwangii]PRX44327.1 BirA family biotin operon repressor/biotin-[acetyl-CoA-carboxylase] ligase [Prauserella shujinwangii]
MPSLDAARLRAELVRPTGPYAALDVVASTGSTNADLREAVTEGAADRTVLIAEQQTAGLGRRGRMWVSPPDTGLYLSVLLRPERVPFSGYGSLAVAAGLAVVDTATELGARVVLKWPNDVLARDGRGKCAGILAEAVASDENAVVLGLGVNVRRAREPVRPGPGSLPAVSLAELGARVTDRTKVARLLLASLHAREKRWRAARGDLAAAGLLADYRAHCATLGQEVKVTVAGAKALVGRAVDVDEAGALVLDTTSGRRTVFAGDVTHLRPAVE